MKFETEFTKIANQMQDEFNRAAAFLQYQNEFAVARTKFINSTPAADKKTGDERTLTLRVEAGATGTIEVSMRIGYTGVIVGAIIECRVDTDNFYGGQFCQKLHLRASMLESLKVIEFRRLLTDYLKGTAKAIALSEDITDELARRQIGGLFQMLGRIEEDKREALQIG